jgi:hypothetical protein
VSIFKENSKELFLACFEEILIKETELARAIKYTLLAIFF